VNRSLPDTAPDPFRINWTALFGLFTGIAVLQFGYHYLDDLARAHHGTLAIKFIEEFTGVYTVFALLPFVVAMTRRFPWRGGNWPAVLAVQAGGAIVFSLAHTTLMALTRQALFPLFGLGRYDYGAMIYRYPMEMSNDIIFYAGTVTLLYLVARLREARRRELEAAHLETELERAKLDNLRLQLQPHFLFNTLNAISAVMYEDPRAADAMIVRLSDFLRLTLEAFDAHETRLEEELRITALYVEIMRGRLENRLVLRSDCTGESSRALVPTMILQPLVENAIVHGTSQERRHLDIDIAARREGEALIIAVNDDGLGLASPAGPALSSGRGLTNTRSRLAQLYGARFDMFIGERPGGGTSVELHLPFRAA
jgi:two-component system, LytTR family, sensor kinase